MNLFLVVICALIFFAHEMYFEESNYVTYFLTIGNATCNDTALPNVTIRLFQQNENKSDLVVLNQTLTSSSGYYDLFGTWENRSRFSNKISVTHTCDVTNTTLCTRTFNFSFPLSYLQNSSEEAHKKPYRMPFKLNSDNQTGLGEEICINETVNENKKENEISTA